MDAASNRRNDFLKLLNSLSWSQKASIALAAGFVVGLMLYFALRGTTSDKVPLIYGKSLTTSELAEAEQALLDEGLTEFERRGQQLYVPPENVDRYHAALMTGQALPGGWASELQRQMEGSSGVFESSRTGQERSKIALAKSLQQVVEGVPGVQRASVIWTPPQTARWPHGKSRTKASVNVLMKRGHSLDPGQIQSIRHSVSSMVPDLAEADVTLFDIGAGVAYKADDIDPLEGALQRRIQQFRENYQTQIANALSYIPGVIVTVNIDVDNLKSRVERSREMSKTNTATIAERTFSREESFNQRRIGGEPGVTNNQPQSLATSSAPEKSGTLKEDDARSTSYPGMTISEQEFFGAMPKAVQVSISIPRSYYEAVAVKQGTTAGATDEEKAAFEATVANIETEEIRKARAAAGVLIPVGSPDSAIVVDTYMTVAEAPAEVAPSLVEGAMGFFSTYGSSLILLALAAFALWTLKKQLPALPELPDEKPAIASETSEAEPEPEPVPPELLQKQGLQTLAHNNPEQFASIIETWVDQAV